MHALHELVQGRGEGDGRRRGVPLWGGPRHGTVHLPLLVQPCQLARGAEEETEAEVREL